MTKPAEIRELIAETERHFGGVDILVNNAGIQHVALIVEFPEERWDAVIAINLSAAFHASKAALPLMIRKKWGRIINIASAHGLVASGEKAAYVAAKHGLVGLTKVTAIELANQGITCNAICPGTVQTPSLDERISNLGGGADARQFFLQRQPTGRFGSADEIAALAVYLASDESAFTTGTVNVIDGGWSV